MATTTTANQQIIRPASLLFRVGVAASVVVLCTAVALDGLPGWEEELFERLNGGPRGLESVLWLPMQLGSLFGPLLLALLSWWAWRRWRPSVGALVAGVLSWQAAKLIKDLVERGRPFQMVENFADRFGTPYEGLGFVSGHSAVVFSLAGVISPYLSRTWRVAAYGMALTVCLARIQVSAHLPLDVVAGAALGYGIANLWNMFVGVPGSPVPDPAVLVPGNQDGTGS
jgi:membrane-associated phospholipid phosphatase